MAFIDETRQLFVTRPSLGYRNTGLVSQELPQSHLLGAIHLLCRGTVTATSLAAMTNGYSENFGCPPFSIIRRIRVRNNLGVNMIDASAWALFCHNLTEARGNQAINDPVGFTRTGSIAAFSRYFEPVATSGTSSNFRFGLTLPIALGKAALTGLQNLQNPDVRYTLEVEWGAPTDVAGGSGLAIADGTGATVTPILELYTIPSNPKSWPDFGVSRLIQEDRQSISTTGEQTYNLTTGPTYNKLLFEPIVNSFPLPMANITSWRARYAQAQEFLSIDPDVQAFLQRRVYGQDLPSGVYVFDYLLGNGLPELPSGRDMIDTSRITDMQFLMTTNATITGTCYLRVLKDFMAPNNAV